MSKKSTPKPEVKKLEEQIKPILEKLTFDVLKHKPDNIVSIYNILFFYIAKIYVWLFKKIMPLWIKWRWKKKKWKN